MIALQLIEKNDAKITPNDIKLKNNAKIHVVDRYFDWESAAKMLAEMINTDSIDTENFFIKLVDENK
jgi:hypothetical protein